MVSSILQLALNIMAALGLQVAQDIAAAALDFYVRGKTIKQTMQARPLLKLLQGSEKSFPGGKQYISVPVQGQFMSDTQGFMIGVSNDDQLQFAQAANIIRPQVPWKQVHSGFIITFTECLQDGVSISDRGTESEHAETELTRLTAILENRLEDFGESWARSINLMLWRDGSQDAKALPGVKSILIDNPLAGVTEGLDRGTYAWWRHRVNLALAVSPAEQKLTKFLRNEVIQLKRYGGRNWQILCGSRFWDGIMQEATEKGLYTQTGFANGVDIGIETLKLKGIGEFEYDPTLDDLGESSRAYVLSTPHMTLRPIEGEANKTLKPERPYNYLVLLKSMTWAGGLIADQLNCHAIYGLQ